MEKSRTGLIFILMLAAWLSGCAALGAGAAAVTAGTGTYLYVNGEMKTDYPYSFERVWKASEKVVATMKGTDVVPSREISEGTIEATIDGERVRFFVKYKAVNATTVAIRVGVLGSEQSSQFLHDKISRFLTDGS